MWTGTSGQHTGSLDDGAHIPQALSTQLARSSHQPREIRTKAAQLGETLIHLRELLYERAFDATTWARPLIREREDMTDEPSRSHRYHRFTA